jgi:hypothetical protein
MKVHVLSNFEHVDTVDASLLNRLISAKSILAFHRSMGWVKLGADPVRGDGGQEYDGPERRNFRQKPLKNTNFITSFFSWLFIV